VDSRVFITGAGGFIGSHLTKAFLSAGYSVFPSQSDILNLTLLRDELRGFNPTTIIHLAAISHPQVCDLDPLKAKAVNVNGTQNLLELAAKLGSLERFVFSSTAQIYAPLRNGESTLTEESEVGPINLYAETKLKGEDLVREFSAATKKNAVVFRIFNHVHRTQPAQTFLSSIYKGMLETQSGNRSVRVGNLDLYRDIGSIRDLLQAFIAVIRAPNGALTQTEAMNICNGKPRLLRNLAELLAMKLGGGFKFEIDPARFRPGEPTTILGSHDLATQKLGWKPLVSSDADLIDEFLGEIKYV
jgi:nucleoside-diphosphate-sugar epimerase